MPNNIAAFPTVVFQVLDSAIVMRVASEVGTGLKEVLRGRLGETVVPSSEVVKKESGDTVSLTWTDGNLTIAHAPLLRDVHRYDFVWTSAKPNKLVDCFEMTGAHWYGGAQVRKMTWPIESMRFKTAPFVAGDSYKDGEWGGVQERYWLSSKGIAIFVRPDVPLFVGVNESNDNLLRLTTKYDAPYRNNLRSLLQMRYSVYHGPDIMTTHRVVMTEMIPKPLGVPDNSMFRLPMWSTWSICKDDIDQEKVLLLASQIKTYGIVTSHLQIDDHWAVHRGDWDFNREKFPNPREMIRRLNELGFQVTIWVHPFANIKSANIKKADLFVKGMTKGVVKWWNGIGRILDITNPAAVEWFKTELGQLQENYALASFKFDGGEAIWLPKKWSLHKLCNNPNMYTKKYAEFAYEMDKRWKSVEVRVGVRTQKLPIFVRMMDKDSVWDEKNGLRSIIPQALLYGIIGFPFFIPDMVGGNAYDMDRPTKSLFIRWVQVCTFMPSIQFSLPPWWFDNQTVRITKKMLALRAKYADLLLKLAQEAVETGNPIIRPLWWVAPQDDFALKCDDEFLVGDDMLVAPVLTKGAKTRPLYLPNGRWRDEKSGHIMDGSKWYFEYKVTIEDLPHFTRIKEPEPAPLVDIADDKTLPLVPVPVPKTKEVLEQSKETDSEPVAPVNEPVAPDNEIGSLPAPLVSIPAAEVAEVIQLAGKHDSSSDSESDNSEPARAPDGVPVAAVSVPAAGDGLPTEPDMVTAAIGSLPATTDNSPAVPVQATSDIVPAMPNSVSAAADREPAAPSSVPDMSNSLLAAPGTVSVAPVTVPSANVAQVIKSVSNDDSSSDSDRDESETARATSPNIANIIENISATDKLPEIRLEAGLVKNILQPPDTVTKPKTIEGASEDMTVTPGAILGFPAILIHAAEQAAGQVSEQMPVIEIAESIKRFSASVDDFSKLDHYESSDDEELHPPSTSSDNLSANMKPAIQEDVASESADESLASVLRRRLEADVDAMKDGQDLTSLLRGKYRFTSLHEDIDDEFLAELSEVASSTGSVDARDEDIATAGSDNSDEDDEFFTRESEQIQKDMAYFLSQKSVEVKRDSASDLEGKHFRAPLASQETITEPEISRLEVEKPEANVESIDETDKKSEGLDPAVLFGGLSSKLDQIVPPRPERENKIMTHLTRDVDNVQYENVASLKADTFLPVPVPVQMRQKSKPIPKPSQPRKSTLWDELTDKLKDMPKFDPEFEQPGGGARSVSIQTSTDNPDRGRSKLCFATQTSTEI